jgi:hypothetical protein
MDSDDDNFLEEIDSDPEYEGYDEFENLSNKIEENTEKRNYLIQQKMNLLLQFNLNKPGKEVIDEEVYRAELNKINQELLKIDNFDRELTNDLVNKEIEFVDMLESYIDKSKKGIKLSEDEVAKIKALNYLINSLRDEYNVNFEPESSEPKTWDDFENEEMNQLKNIIKRLKLKIKVPEEKNFNKKEDFEKAWNNFFNFMIPYIPVYETRINPTGIGTITEEVSKENILLNVKEDLNEIKRLNIKLSVNDIKDIQDFKNLEKKLLDIDQSELIDCIQNSNVKIPYTYIDELKNNKIKVLKYEKNIPVTQKQPENIKYLLVSILESLGFDKKELINKNKKELEDILNINYSIPPSLYFNKSFKYNTLILDKEGNTRNLTLNYNSRMPIVIVKKYPIPKDIEITNDKFYEQYVPVSDSLYNKIKDSDNVQEIWMIPYKIQNGKYILKKITKFEEYLNEIKLLINNNIIKNKDLILKEKDLSNIAYLEEYNEKLKYRIYQIDEYLKSGKILPPYKLTDKKKFDYNIPGISYVTKWQRKVTIQKLSKILNKELGEKLENIIYQSINNVSDYYSKINNAIFVLDTYPDIKNKILIGDINLYKFVLFDRYFLYKKSSSKPSIENRRIVLNKIKKALKKGLSSKKRIKYSILGDIIINNESKRIELLLFDLSENSKSSEYLSVSNKLEKILEIESFASDIVTNKITDEQLVIIIKRIKNDLNSKIVKKALSKFIDISDNQIYKNDILRDTRIIRYKKFTINELEALISQKRLQNKEIQKDKLISKNKELDNQLDKNINDIEKLQNVINSKILLINKVKRQLLNKYTKPKVKVTSYKGEKKIINADENLIFELIQSYKRKLIIDNFNFSLYKNKLLILLELHDLNELSFKLNKIPKEVYIILKNRYNSEINMIFNNVNTIKSEKKVLPTIVEEQSNRVSEIIKGMKKPIIKQSSKKVKDFSFDDNYYYIRALAIVSSQLKGTKNLIIDYYGNDLFSTLYNSISPFDFYNKQMVKDYNIIVSNITPSNKQVYKTQMVLYNPDTRKFGSNASDGYLFNVYRLEKDSKTGLPIVMQMKKEEINPRTGQITIIPVEYEKPGNTYYMKLPIINPNDLNDRFRWLEVPLGAVGMYELNYDSCSRFNNENDCNSGIGLSRSKCKYKDKKCVAEYNLK